jgi:hypothetical protein
LAVDKVIAKFKGRVLFKQYIPKKRKRFITKMVKLEIPMPCVFSPGHEANGDIQMCQV